MEMKVCDAYIGIFTARCYAERGYATVCRLSVRPSVTFRYRDHISWNISKIISRLISFYARADPNTRGVVQREVGNTPNIRVE